MTIILKIPDLVDHTINGINQQISNLQTRVNTMSNDLNAIKGRGPTSPTGPSSKLGVLPSSSGVGGLQGGPPPPPGGPPGGPPAGPSRPANPQSLRGAIMGELKQLFAKRKQ